MPRKTRKMLVGKAVESAEQQEREAMCEQLVRELRRQRRQAMQIGEVRS